MRCRGGGAADYHHCRAPVVFRAGGTPPRQLLPGASVPTVSYPDCFCCPGGGGSGSGSGGSGGAGDGEVVVGCCPDPVPRTLYATFGGDLAFLGTIAVVYDDGTGTWLYTPVDICGETGKTLEVLCVSPGVWSWSLTGPAVGQDCQFGTVTGGGGGESTGGWDDVTCDPVYATGEFVALLSEDSPGACTCATGLFTFTVTLSEVAP